MPSVLNLPSARAVAQLQQAGLSVNTRQDFSETVAAGLVISSDPQPGARVRKDATVSIDVSRGPTARPCRM
ncbi:PASTA domain-containing protein [Streptacidiphilus monticola]